MKSLSTAKKTTGGKRTVILIISLFFLTLAIPAQVDYRPFVEEGKTWETTISEIMEDCYGSFIEGDTLIGGETWKKVHNYIGFEEFGGTYYAAVREEGKKVYAIAKGSEKPRLLYDFGLKVGSTIRCGVEGNSFGCLLDNGAEPDARTHDYRKTIKESLWVCSKELDSKNSCGQKPQLVYCANLRF